MGSSSWIGLKKPDWQFHPPRNLWIYWYLVLIMKGLRARLKAGSLKRFLESSFMARFFPEMPSPSRLLLLPGNRGEQINSKQSVAWRSREATVVTPAVRLPLLCSQWNVNRPSWDSGGKSPFQLPTPARVIPEQRLTDSWFPLLLKRGWNPMTSTSERSEFFNH